MLKLMISGNQRRTLKPGQPLKPKDELMIIPALGATVPASIKPRVFVTLARPVTLSMSAAKTAMERVRCTPSVVTKI
jgi:hypothetical protein